MIVPQSRRQVLGALLGMIPVSLYFWRSEAFSRATSRSTSDACDIVMVDGWILRREDLRKARIDAA